MTATAGEAARRLLAQASPAEVATHAEIPTQVPTRRATDTEVPTEVPTQTEVPTRAATRVPTPIPSAVPTLQATSTTVTQKVVYDDWQTPVPATHVPTQAPTQIPTQAPTSINNVRVRTAWYQYQTPAPTPNPTPAWHWVRSNGQWVKNYNATPVSTPVAASTPVSQALSGLGSGMGSLLLNHLILEVGWKHFIPQNNTFYGQLGSIEGGVLVFSWDDILNLEFDGWERSGLSIGNVTDLTGLGFEPTLTWPFRFPFLTLYAGGGGRFESVNVTASGLSSDTPVRFGNNSVLLTVGAKWKPLTHWGLDLNGAYDVWATYNPNLMFRAGLYYEFGE
jgi:hypothetical protein